MIAAGEEDALFQTGDILLVQSPADGHFVPLVHTVSRVRQAIRELPVIGEQQQA